MITREDIIKSLLCERGDPESYTWIYKDTPNEVLIRAYAKLGIKLEVVTSGLFLIKKINKKVYL